jgi:type VII secretion integral membrane protein EccD
MVDNACSVTVVGSRTRVDVWLPGSVAVAELVWDLVDLLAEPEVEGGPPRWGLVRAGGRILNGERGLADQGVTDGSLLFLRDLARPPEPPAVDDYAEAVAFAVEAHGGRWTSGGRQAAMLAVAIGWLVAAAAVTLRLDDLVVRTATAFVAAALLPVAGALVARALKHSMIGALLALSALPFWAVGGGGAGALLGVSGPALYSTVAGFVAAGALVALLAGVMTRAPAAGVVGAFGVPAAVVAVGLALGLNIVQMAAVLAALALLAVRFLPPLAVRLSGLAGARSLDPAALKPKVAAGHGLLGAMVIAAAAVMAASCVVLGVYGGWYEWGLLAALALGAATQVRHFRFAVEAAPLVVAALVALSALGFAFLRSLYADPRLRPALVGVALASALVLVAVGLLGRRRRLPPPLRRRLDQLEALALVASIPLAAGSLGAYSAVAALAHHLA